MSNPDYVRIELKLSDWFYVPTRTHTKTVEIPREDWETSDQHDRKQLILDELNAFVEESLETDWEVLDGDDINDPVVD